MKTDYDWSPPAPARLRKKIGPYSRGGALAMVDKRSREAQFVKRTRKQLIEQFKVGSEDAARLILAERAAWIALKCAQIEAKIASDRMHEHDRISYLAWANSLRLIMRDLGAPQGQPAQLPARTVARQEWRVNGRSFDTLKEAQAYQEKLREHGVPMAPIEHLQPLPPAGAVEVVDTGRPPR